VTDGGQPIKEFSHKKETQMANDSLPDLSPAALSRLVAGMTTDEVEAIVGRFHRPNLHEGCEYFAWVGEGGGGMLRAFFKGSGRTLSAAVLDLPEEQRQLDLGPDPRRRARATCSAQEEEGVDASWLKRRLTVAEAEAEHMVRDGRLGPNPIPFGWAAAEWHQLLTKMQPGDELWEYDSPQEDWDRLMGSQGIALVRGGQVIATLVLRMN
jgi:hypothetical protein